MAVTNNYGLPKPQLTDKINETIIGLSDAMENIDTELKKSQIHSEMTDIHHTHSNKTALDSINMNLLNSMTAVVFGIYNGNGKDEQFINLGFTPVAVEVYSLNGLQCETYQPANDTYYHHYGGLALLNNPCRLNTLAADPIIKIVNGGFNVYYKRNTPYYIYTNTSGKEFYFKAYKNGEIITV